MDLIQLKQYLRERRLVSLRDVALHFKTDEEIVRPMLDVWIAKGKLRRHEAPSGGCKGCCQCSPALLESYEWLN